MRPFQTSPPNLAEICPAVLAEHSFYFLKVDLRFMEAWKVLEGRAPPELYPGSLCAGMQSTSLQEDREDTPHLVTGTARPGILRGAFGCSKWPVTAVGGEAPAA